MRYVGTDIVAASNVHVVGDAHRLGSMFPKDEFDAVYAAYVFEHLLMPWKVVLELKQPWDFWRFSNSAWQALFNADTGFRIVDTALGEPSSIVAHLCTQPLRV